jgi:hypothetical protein
MLKIKYPLPGNYLERNQITVNNKIAADVFDFQLVILSRGKKRVVKDKING